jgi:hypothetical protein
VVSVTDLVPVLDDAPNLNGRQRKNLGLSLELPGLRDQLVIRLPGKWNDRAIRMDGSTGNRIDLCPGDSRDIGKLNVGVFLALSVRTFNRT